MKKTLLIAGTGSVENGWDPVKRGLIEYYEKKGIIVPDDVRDLNLVLTNIVHRLRWAYKLAPSGKVTKAIMHEYLEVKKRIAHQLEKAEKDGTIKLRAEITKVKRHFFTERIRIMTTNWDLLFAPFVRDTCDLHFFHGNCKNADDLFLPAETTEENYLSKSQRKGYRRRLSRALHDSFKDVHSLILYGISLSPLDAELGIIIKAGLSEEKPKRIVIVDKEPCIVYQRLRFLLLEKWKTLTNRIDSKLLRPSML